MTGNALSTYCSTPYSNRFQLGHAKPALKFNTVISVLTLCDFNSFASERVLASDFFYIDLFFYSMLSWLVFSNEFSFNN